MLTNAFLRQEHGKESRKDCSLNKKISHSQVAMGDFILAMFKNKQTIFLFNNYN